MMGRITTSMQVVNFGTIPLGAVLRRRARRRRWASGPRCGCCSPGSSPRSLILLALPVRGLATCRPAAGLS